MQLICVQLAIEGFLTKKI